MGLSLFQPALTFRFTPGAPGSSTSGMACPGSLEVGHVAKDGHGAHALGLQGTNLRKLDLPKNGELGQL